MKNLFAVVAMLGMFITACNSKSDEEKTAATTDTTLVPEAKMNEKTDPVTGKMVLTGAAKIGQPINVTFSVYNNTDSVVKFCKWHTPFERLMSKYLDVALEDHTNVDYSGPMAKRVMPPPADSYVSLKKGDSTSTSFNLADAYPISKPGVYTIKYNSSAISGIVVADSLKINVTN